MKDACPDLHSRRAHTHMRGWDQQQEQLGRAARAPALHMLHERAPSRPKRWCPGLTDKRDAQANAVEGSVRALRSKISWDVSEWGSTGQPGGKQGQSAGPCFAVPGWLLTGGTRASASNSRKCNKHRLPHSPPQYPFRPSLTEHEVVCCLRLLQSSIVLPCIAKNVPQLHTQHSKGGGS